MIGVWNKGFFDGLRDVIKAINIKGWDKGSLQDALGEVRLIVSESMARVAFIKASVTKRWCLGVMTDEKKEETGGTATGLLNGRMTLSVRQRCMQLLDAAGVKSSGVEKPQYHGGVVVWVISASLVGGCWAIVIMRGKWLWGGLCSGS